jgi:hypothetical protein
MDDPLQSVRRRSLFNDLASPLYKTVLLQMDEESDYVENFETVKVDGRKGRPRPNLTFSGEKKTRHNYMECKWAKLLREDREALEHPLSRESLLFRLRFRVPYQIFQELVTFTKTWYKVGPSDVSGRPSIPVELKILGVLRILGKPRLLLVPSACSFSSFYR